MKRTISYLLCITMLIALVLSGCGSTKTAPVIGTVTSLPSAGSRNVVVFGDSIAAGYGLDDQSKNYVNIFSTNIGATLKNDAVSGYDSSNLLELLKGGSVSSDIIRANIIILSIGGNDILHQKTLMISTIKQAALHGGDYFTDDINAIYTNFESNLRACIGAIRTLNPNAVIIIQTVYNPVLKQGYKVSAFNVAKLVNRYIVKLNDSIINVCTGMPNVCIFNVADEMNKDADNFYKANEDFDIHPTVHGHASLAAIYTKDFNSLVK